MKKPKARPVSRRVVKPLKRALEIGHTCGNGTSNEVMQEHYHHNAVVDLVTFRNVQSIASLHIDVRWIGPISR